MNLLIFYPILNNDQRDDFNFEIIDWLHMCSNIPASPAYGAYISQLIRYARASSNYSDFLNRHLYLRNRLLDQGYEKIRLNIFLTFVLTPLSLYIFTIWKSIAYYRLCRDGYISTRSWYRNINLLRDRIRRIFS
jgi:hypothetical protein